MKKLYCFVLCTVLMLCTNTLYAQQAKDSTNTKWLRSFFKCKFGDIAGLEWEQKIGQKSVITFFAGLSFGYPVDNIDLRNNFLTRPSSIVYFPNAYIEYRYYYNLVKRIVHKKNTNNNSADFVYGRVENIYQQKTQNYFGLLFIQGWGKQFAIGKRGLWKKITGDCHLGIKEHFYYDRPPIGGFNYIKIEPHIAGTLSYAF